MTAPDGDPAFPSKSMDGMSYRKWCAGIALIRILPHNCYLHGSVNFSEHATSCAVELAYKIADAMIKYDNEHPAE